MVVTIPVWLLVAVGVALVGSVVLFCIAMAFVAAMENVEDEDE